MAFEGVPYFTGGGASHSPEVMRLVAYLAMGGQEGIIDSTDWQVKALQTPGAGVRITPGAGGILHRSPGFDKQMYLGRSRDDTTLQTTDTDSSGSRSDLVIVRVEDPEMPDHNYPIPDDVANGPYIFGRIITGVPPGTKSLKELFPEIGTMTGFAMARIDRDANTSTVEQGMIEDLRVVSNPITGVGPAPGGAGAEKLWTEAVDLVGGTTSLPATQGTFIVFPQESVHQVNVPDWATGADVYCIVNPQLDYGTAFGEARFSVGSASVTSTFDMNPAGDYANAGGQRQPMLVAGTMSIPSDLRGTTATVKLEARSYNTYTPAPTGTLSANPNTNLYMQINFKQHPVFG